MSQYGGYVPFDELSRIKTDTKSSNATPITDGKRVKPKNRHRTHNRQMTHNRQKGKDKKANTSAKSFLNAGKCGESQVIVEKESGKKRCAKCTESGIIIRGEDDNLYILKSIRSINKWVKII